jgi:serine protease Do
MDDDFFQWFFEGRGMESTQKGYVQQGGTGFIIRKDGYILTNNHVVGDADKITVKLNDGRQFDARRIGADPRSEVAVIKIEADNLPALETGDSSALEIGEWVIAIGNQFGFFAETLTVGVVSATGRSDLNLSMYEDYIQTDAAINPGNSGGPLLNLEGKVVGINTAIISQTGGFSGIGLAVPINMANVIADQLIKTGKVVRGYLGVSFGMPPDVAEGAPVAAGAYVANVMPGSPAHKAGLKADDIIVEVNGRRMRDARMLMNTIAFTAPNTETTLKVMRSGSEKTVKLAVGTFPEDVEVSSASGSVIADRLGLSVADFTPALAAKYGYESGYGVVITAVAKQSIGEEAGLEAGHMILAINRRMVNSTAEFSKALEDAAQSKRILMRVRDSANAWFVLLSLE